MIIFQLGFEFKYINSIFPSCVGTPKKDRMDGGIIMHIQDVSHLEIELGLRARKQLPYG